MTKISIELDKFSNEIKDYLKNLILYNDNKDLDPVANQKSAILSKIKIINEAITNKNSQEIIKSIFANNFPENNCLSDSEIKLIENLEENVKNPYEFANLHKICAGLKEFDKLCKLNFKAEKQLKKANFHLELMANYSTIKLSNNNLTVSSEHNAGNVVVFGNIGFKQGIYAWNVIFKSLAHDFHGCGIGLKAKPLIIGAGYVNTSIFYNPTKGCICNNLLEKETQIKVKKVDKGNSIQIILDCNNSRITFIATNFNYACEIPKGLCYYPLLLVYNKDVWIVDPLC